MKTPPQTKEQMIEAESERKGNAMYRKESLELIDQRIAENVTQTAQELKEAANTQPVSLRDVDRVKQLTISYMESCAETSTIPSIMGLMRALGLARSSFYDVLTRKSPPETYEWFLKVHDAFSELMSNASLRGEVNTISSIFLLKALYQFKEQATEIVVSKGSNSPYDGMTSDEAAAAIMEKYADMIED